MIVNCPGCGRPVETIRIFCSTCGRAVAPRPAGAAREARKRPRLEAPFGIAGLLTGAFAGFLARPHVSAGYQLPFLAVMSRGATLRGVDRYLVNTAQQSFDRMVLCALIGAAIAIAVAVVLRVSEPVTRTPRR